MKWRVQTKRGTQCKWDFWTWALVISKLRERLLGESRRIWCTAIHAKPVLLAECLPLLIILLLINQDLFACDKCIVFASDTFDRSQKTRMLSKLWADRWCTFESCSSTLTECNFLWTCSFKFQLAWQNPVKLLQSECRTLLLNIDRIIPSTSNKSLEPLNPFNYHSENFHQVSMWA